MACERAVLPIQVHLVILERENSRSVLNRHALIACRLGCNSLYAVCIDKGEKRETLSSYILLWWVYTFLYSCIHEYGHAGIRNLLLCYHLLLTQ